MRARVLEQDTEYTGLFKILRRIADDHLVTESCGAGPDDLDRLGMYAAVNEELHVLVPAHALDERHRLGGCGALVEEGRVRNVEPGEVAHSRLKVDERFEPSLGDLRLVRGVSGVPTWILENIALDDAGRDRSVVPHADEGSIHLVLIRDAAHPFESLGLCQRAGDIGQPV